MAAWNMAPRCGIETLGPVSSVLLPSGSFGDGKWRGQKSFPSSKEAKIGMTRRYYADRRRSLKWSIDPCSLTGLAAQLSSQTARERTSWFYRKAGIKVSKVSHAPRVAATQNADIAGVDEGQIRRAGRWNNGEQMTRCYLTSLPFEFMRAVADFDPEWSGSYLVPRAAVRPPVVLLVQVWPQLDKWKEAHSSPLSDFGVEQNMAAGAFLELMEWLREVLLQDAVFLRESYPDHPLFQDPVFACPVFAAFAGKVRNTCASAHEDSHATVIQKAMPVVVEKLRIVLTQQVTAEQLAERRHVNLLRVARDLSVKLEDFAQTTCSVTFSPGRGTAAQQTQVSSARQGRRHAAGEAIKFAAGGALAGREGKSNGRSGLHGDWSRSASELRLPRSIDSAQSLLRLWRQGWGDMPSVDSLERDWGTRWRLLDEKNYFSTRKTIVNEVRGRAQKDGLGEEVVARKMDEKWGYSSLDELFKAIRGSRRNEPMTLALGDAQGYGRGKHTG
ncbi:hypothetical protein HIM_10428 [Hirsutella minnesotensis 3608]|uniref:Transcription activator GCR1-like domain-containing protein n=1 Tax=Hirsutella minnesotensis 3608 TaxID=1043627 RepID=A0A0F7ZRT4_9HYPO|nr:hypothetical protein HIM_10428 [Hirsutella minnesotensis 3608]